MVNTNYLYLIIIISLLCLRSSGLLCSHASICRVSPKICANSVGNRELEMELLEQGIQRTWFFLLAV
jgi:hypothetical protein